jgi:hypothetical protein
VVVAADVDDVADDRRRRLDVVPDLGAPSDRAVRGGDADAPRRDDAVRRRQSVLGSSPGPGSSPVAVVAASCR